LRISCYCDACLNSSDLRVGVTTLLNTIQYNTIIEDFLVTVLLPHQVFHWPFCGQQWLDFNTSHEFTFKFYLLILPIVAL